MKTIKLNISHLHNFFTDADFNDLRDHLTAYGFIVTGKLNYKNDVIMYVDNNDDKDFDDDDTASTVVMCLTNDIMHKTWNGTEEDYFKYFNWKSYFENKKITPRTISIF